MFTAILIILFGYLLWFIVRPWAAAYARRKMAERFERMVRDKFGFPPPPPGGGRRASSPPPSDRGPRQPGGQKIPDGVGEYVEFEEIDVEYSGKEQTSSRPSGYQPREPRVSDAEWEDVP